MNKEEGQAIFNYKEYFLRHFGEPKHLCDLYVGHYDGDPQDVHHLDQYLATIRVYSKKLRRAADLRQYHYEHFITIEEPGHAHWRVGLNQITEDAENKLKYWEEKRDSAWDQLPLVYDLAVISNRVKNPDDYTNITVIRPQKILRPPPISKRMQLALTKARKEAENQTLETLMVNFTAQKERIQSINASCAFDHLDTHTIGEFLAKKDDFDYWNLMRSKITSTNQEEVFKMITHLKVAFCTTYNFNYLMHITKMRCWTTIMNDDEVYWIGEYMFALLGLTKIKDYKRVQVNLSNLIGSIFCDDHEEDGKHLINCMSIMYKRTGDKKYQIIASCALIGKVYKACYHLQKLLYRTAKRTSVENVRFLIKHDKTIHRVLNLKFDEKMIDHYHQIRPDPKLIIFYKELCNLIYKI